MINPQYPCRLAVEVVVDGHGRKFSVGSTGEIHAGRGSELHLLWHSSIRAESFLAGREDVEFSGFCGRDLVYYKFVSKLCNSILTNSRLATLESNRQCSITVLASSRSWRQDL